MLNFWYYAFIWYFFFVCISLSLMHCLYNCMFYWILFLWSAFRCYFERRYLVNFLQYFIVRVIEDWYSAAVSQKRTWAHVAVALLNWLSTSGKSTKGHKAWNIHCKNQADDNMDSCCHLSLTVVMETDQPGIRDQLKCLLASSKPSEKLQNRAEQMFYHHPSLTNALVRNQKIINY